MKLILSLILFLALASCTSFEAPPGFQEPSRINWSTFEIPPVGTPVMLRVFHLVAPRTLEVVDLKGKWDDGDPFTISFVVTKRMEQIVRVEIHFRGLVLGARNFRTPTLFEKGRTVGWRK